MNPSAIIFDFDGVILDSVEAKTNAFAELFASYGEHEIRKLLRYHKENGGISRFVKFSWFYEHVLGQKITNEELQELGQQFKHLAFQNVLQAEFVSGALDFIKEFSDFIPLFIASGTPQEELEEIVIRRNLNCYFREVHGSPRKKADIVRDILLRYQLIPENVWFVGDAMTDYLAAQECNVSFVGIVSILENNPFPWGTKVKKNIEDLRVLIKRCS